MLLQSITLAYSQLSWQISGNGRKKSSCLFGTQHVIDKGKIPAFEQFRKLIRGADAVVGELDMSNLMSMLSNPF